MPRDIIDLKPTLCYKLELLKSHHASLAMIEVSKGAASKDRLADDARWALVHRIVSSGGFTRAAQLRDILLYLSRRALEDNPKAISEEEVGRNALGRPADFNPNEDNIVRGQVRHLRQKLEEYFSTEGRDEPLILLIPKGTYVPQFGDRAAHPPPPPGEHHEPAGSGWSLLPGRYPGMDSDSAKPAYPWLSIGVLAALLAASAVLSLVLWRQNADLRRAAPTQNHLPPNEDVLWPRMFAPDQDTSIVMADTSVVMVEALTGVEVPLDNYSGAAYADKMINSVRDRSTQTALRIVTDMQSTSLADANIAVRLMEVCHQHNGRCTIRYSRFLAAREFQTGNFILIGSRQSNPWVGLFEPQLNFYFEPDPKTQRFRIRNRSPLPGEQDYYVIRNRPLFPGERDHYRSFPTDKVVEESYSDLALLPNLTGTGNVLIISGLGMSDTEATGELITSPGFSTTLAKILNSKAGKSPAPYVEILFQFNEMSEVARGSKIVAYRLITPPKSEPP